jgi:hypothetical protein
MPERELAMHKPAEDFSRHFGYRHGGVSIYLNIKTE